MTQTPSSERPPAGRPTVYRGGAAVVFGGVFAALCIASAVDLVVEAGSADLVGAAVLLLVAGLAIVLGPYPAAFSRDDGLRIRNPFRQIDLPWPVVTEVKAGWSFLACTAERKFTIWAIPVSMRERQKMQRDQYREAARQLRDAKRTTSGRGGAFGSMMSPGGSGGSSDPSRRVPFADQAVTEINARREAYAVRLKREEIARAHGFTPSGKRIGAKADADAAENAQPAEADKPDKADKIADVAEHADTSTPQTPAAEPAEPAATAPAASVTWPVFPLVTLGVPAVLVIISVIVK